MTIMMGRHVRKILNVAAAAALAGAVLALPASAGPLGLGAPRLPNVTGTLNGVVNRTTSGLASDLNVVRDSVGRPRAPRLIEKDANGFRIVRGEVLALSPSDGSLKIARGLNFRVVREEGLGPLGLRVTVLEVPDDTDTADALNALRRADPTGTYDLDHIYDPSGSDRAEGRASPRAPQAVPDRTVRIGMIDGGFDPHLDIFANATIVASDCGTKSAVATKHGSAVASLLVGTDEDVGGALPGATLYAADAFCGLPTGGNVVSIARALAWLAAEKVPVANVSLAGPPNALLAAAVAAFQKPGRVIVAAVGNDGPAAGIEYPAGYPGVVGVTSVDAKNAIQVEANRGNDVAFAALGVEVTVAGLRGGHETVTGTSFAAPIVAARFALLVPDADPHAVSEAWTELERAAQHLGPPGRNDVFGYGLIERMRRPAGATAAK